MSSKLKEHFKARKDKIENLTFTDHQERLNRVWDMAVGCAVVGGGAIGGAIEMLLVGQPEAALVIGIIGGIVAGLGASEAITSGVIRRSLNRN